MRSRSILILISFILIVIWFRGGTIRGGGDASLAFYSPSIALNLSKTIWVEYGTGGSTIGYLPTVSTLYFYSLLEKLGISTFILQASLFFVIMSFGVISIYYLCLLFFEKDQKRETIAFIAALFYSFNPFTMSQIWARGQAAQQSAFALLPLGLLLFALGVKKKEIIFAVFIALASVIFSTAFSFLTFIIVFWLALFIYFLFNRSLFSLKLFLTTLFLWIAVNCWWFIPLFSSSGSIYSAGISGFEENLGTLMGVSRNFTPDLLIRLLHKTYFFDQSAFSPIYSTKIFQILSWIPVIFLLLGLYTILKNRLSDFKFLITIFILGLIISLGANPPFGFLFVEVFKKISIFQAFRNPFEKFGLVYVLGYSILFAYGLISSFSKQKHKKITIVLVLFLTCSIFAWPMWTGRAIAGPDRKIGLSVPTYYKDLDIFLREKSEDYRIFMTPLWSGDGAFYQWGNGRYQGSDPMIWILTYPSISNTLSTPFYHDFITGMRKYMERMNLTPSLALLRTKYLIDREDAIMLTDREREHKKFLTESIYPPEGVDSDKFKICRDKFTDSGSSGIAWLICQIPNNEGDWSKIRYAHFVVGTDTPAYLEIAIRDKKGTRIRWYGPDGVDYKTAEDNKVIATITLGAPSEYNPAIDFSQVNLIEVLAHPKGSPGDSVKQIFLKEIVLDSGKEEIIDAFYPAESFGNLQVYEPVKFNPPPEYGILSSFEQIEDIVGLFEVANRVVDQLDNKGFLVISQNSGKNLKLLPNESDVYITDKKKVSNTRYWLNVHGDTPKFVLLSKTFNRDWKLIPAVTPEELSGNLFDDLDLLRKTSIDEEKHFVANGYANMWIVEGFEQEYAIVYKPQIVADIGARISRYAIYTLSGIILLYVIKKYAKKIY